MLAGIQILVVLIGRCVCLCLCVHSSISSYSLRNVSHVGAPPTRLERRRASMTWYDDGWRLSWRFDWCGCVVVVVVVELRRVCVCELVVAVVEVVLVVVRAWVEVVCWWVVLLAAEVVQELWRLPSVWLVSF